MLDVGLLTSGRISFPEDRAAWVGLPALLTGQMVFRMLACCVFVLFRALEKSQFLLSSSFPFTLHTPSHGVAIQDMCSDHLLTFTAAGTQPLRFVKRKDNPPGAGPGGRPRAFVTARG